ncbi:hypothetical protein F2Q70_00038243 [Brassica cretica]|uniref:Uncharacterized protein n=1 Tax=Brassica cretica TaxID=69181 RepID=A0A8S9KCC0_BRACR|nr:hypothetical protein F2Q70_00038243 [Brassica cretica]
MRLRRGSPGDGVERRPPEKRGSHQKCSADTGSGGGGSSFSWCSGFHFVPRGGSRMNQLLVSVVLSRSLVFGPLPLNLSRLVFSLGLLKFVSLLLVMFAPTQND